MKEKVHKIVQWLRFWTDHWWYPPLVSLLAALDNFVIFIPTEPLLISSSIMRPRLWLRYSVAVTVGSSLGALVLVLTTQLYGPGLILNLFPKIHSTGLWKACLEFFNTYGLVVVFGVAATPVFQQPVLILAALTQTPALEIFAVTFAGRLVKYLIMGYVASHAPRLLRKMWGLRGDLKDAGVQNL